MNNNAKQKCPKEGLRFGYDVADKLCFYPKECPFFSECKKENLRLFGKELETKKEYRGVI